MIQNYSHFTVISIDSLLVYKKKYYLHVYLDNCAYRIANKQMTHYLDDNLFETDQIKIRCYKFCIMKELI